MACSILVERLHQRSWEYLAIGLAKTLEIDRSHLCKEASKSEVSEVGAIVRWSTDAIPCIDVSTLSDC